MLRTMLSLSLSIYSPLHSDMDLFFLSFSLIFSLFLILFEMFPRLRRVYEKATLYFIAFPLLGLISR